MYILMVKWKTSQSKSVCHIDMFIYPRWRSCANE